jgi:hypothetical protein|tara:strand:- start:1432 stop:1698 length:267 start_codon:yes stop_codon:yes gene_type:complete
VSKKKSYMDKSNLIKEGFFDKIKSFLTSRPKLKGKDKISYLNKIKLALKVSKLNKSIDNFEKVARAELGDEYMDKLNLGRFEPKDFLK